MAIAIDPSDILTRVAFRLHLPAFSSGEFVSDDQALMLLEDACERLSGLLLKAYGANYFTKQATLSTQAGVDVVSLPQGLATIESVYWLASDSRAVRFERAHLVSEELTPSAWDERDTPTYRAEGNVLVLRPVPSGVYSLRIDYQDTPTVTSLSDTIWGQAGWREWLVLDLCEQIAPRQEKDPASFTVRKMKIEADLKAQAADRDKEARPQAVDAYGALGRSRLDWRFSR